MIDAAPHPAKFHDDLLPVIEQYLVPGSLVLDPMAGSGKIHRLTSVRTWGIEIEPEWAVHHPRTIVGNALTLPFADGIFDAIATSPVYGNRMSDSHNAQERCKPCKGEGRILVSHKDDFVAAARAGQEVKGEVRNSVNTYWVECVKCRGIGRRTYKRLTYKHQLNRDPHPESSATMHWGPAYRDFHVRAWTESIRVLRSGGRFVLNVKNHLKAPKKGEAPVEQPVIEWHLWTLVEMGMEPLWSEPVVLKGMGMGENREVRTAHEVVAVLAKPA